MARKAKPELLVNINGELGLKNKEKFETLLNFDFSIAYRVSLGSQLGSGAVYNVYIPGEEPQYVEFCNNCRCNS